LGSSEWWHDDIVLLSDLQKVGSNSVALNTVKSRISNLLQNRKSR
jgi:hypothetical protein